MMRLTLAIPTYEDFAGVWETIQSFRIINTADPWLAGTEIVVVDNKPDGEQGQMVANLHQAWWAGPQHDGVVIRYIPMPRPVGPANAKQRAFEEATGDIVLCVDSHVILPPGAVRAAVQFLSDPTHTRDLVTGPMVYDNLSTVSTHFANRWRGQMWGTWDTNPAALDPRSAPFEVFASGCGCFAMRKAAWVGFNPKFLGFGGEESYVHEKVRHAGGRVWCLPALRWIHRFGKPGGYKAPLNVWYKARNYVIGLTELGIPLDRLHRHFVEGIAEAGQGEPERWEGPFSSGSRGPLDEIGWKMLTADPHNPPPWPPDQPLPPELLPVGGSEPVVFALGDVPPEGVSVWAPVIASSEYKVPTVLAAEAELIVPSPFLQQMATSEDAVPPPTSSLPIVSPPATPSHPSCSQRSQPAMHPLLETMYAQAFTTPSDINEHCPKLRELAGKSDVVVEFGCRRGVSTVAILAGQPKVFITHDLSPADPIVAVLAERAGNTRFEYRQASSLTCDVPECDLLFIDTVHTERQLAAELIRHAGRARHWIVMHDTVVFGQRGEDGGPGLLPAVEKFLAANPTWFIASHEPRNNGLMVLSRDPADRPKEEIKAVQVASPQQSAAPDEGPGKELHALLHSIGIDMPEACDCRSKMAQMNAWKVQGCRDNFNTIVGWMRDGQTRWSWRDKIAAAAKAVATGLAFKLSWTDPFPDLVNEAIRRAEVKK